MLGNRHNPEILISKNFGDRGRGSHEKIDVMEDLQEIQLEVAVSKDCYP
jgi:hypothetical protein